MIIGDTNNVICDLLKEMDFFNKAVDNLAANEGEKRADVINHTKEYVNSCVKPHVEKYLCEHLAGWIALAQFEKAKGKY